MTTSPIRSGRRYRRAIIGLVLVGSAALLGGLAADQSLPGLVVYAVAAVAAVGLTVAGRLRESVVLGDEREAQLERRASHVVFQVFGYLGLFGFVALFLLDATGRYAFPDVARPLLRAYAVICLSWLGVYAILRFRS